MDIVNYQVVLKAALAMIRTAKEEPGAIGYEYTGTIDKKDVEGKFEKKADQLILTIKVSL